MSKVKTLKAKKVSKVANTKKNVASAKKAVAKREAPIGKTKSGRNIFKSEPTKQIMVALVKKHKVVAKKKVAKKVVAKKVVKKPVAKKKTAPKKTKVTLKEKYTKLYKIVSAYSENLMQDVYSVVYRNKTLKRFINEKLANTYIEQEVLVRLNEHAISTAKKSRALKAELAEEFA